MMLLPRIGKKGYYEHIPSNSSGKTDSKSVSVVQPHAIARQILPTEFLMLYELGPLLGSGTTSKVFKLFHRKRQNVIDEKINNLACKIIDKQKMVHGLGDYEMEPLLNQLRKEANILRSICHPNIVSLYDFMETSSSLYFVMEHVQGGELFDHLVHHGALSEKLTCQLMLGVFSAVAYLHERNILHRDIKAENLLLFRRLDGEYALKLIDFGFGTTLQNNLACTFLGTAGYIAPEIRQQKQYSAAVDNWSLGILLFCCLSARLPFPSSTKPMHATEHLTTFKLSFPPAQWLDVSAGCKRLIVQLLDPDPLCRLSAKDALADPWVSDGPNARTLRVVVIIVFV